MTGGINPFRELGDFGKEVLVETANSLAKFRLFQVLVISENDDLFFRRR